jgi:hypothetical protein
VYDRACVQASYRAAPAPPKPVVVFYRPTPTWLGLLLSVVMLAFVVGSGAATLQLTRRVTLDMSRPDDMCTITRSYLLLGDYAEKHALSGIRGTKLISSRDKHGYVSYGVQLTTVDQPIRVSSSFRPYAERDAQRRQIDAFLVGTEPSLHLLYDAGGGVGFMMLLVAVVPLLLLRQLWQGARVTVDPASRMLTVTRTRWPLRAASESIPIGEIENVDVRAVRGRKGGRLYRVALIMRSGQEVPLLRAASNMLGPHRRAADALRAAVVAATAPPTFQA